MVREVKGSGRMGEGEMERIVKGVLCFGVFGEMLGLGMVKVGWVG